MSKEAACCASSNRRRSELDRHLPTGQIAGLDDDPESSYDAPDRYKLVMLGESAVGKSSIVLRLVRGEFHDSSESTIGAAFIAHSITTSSGQAIDFDLWDTAGQERYRSLAPMYYRGAHAAIVVFDMSSTDTYDAAKAWIAEVRRDVPRALFALVGNKADLRRAVHEKDARCYCDEVGLDMYFETSAKTGDGVAKLFATVAEKLLQRRSLVPL